MTTAPLKIHRANPSLWKPGAAPDETQTAWHGPDFAERSWSGVGSLCTRREGLLVIKLELGKPGIRDDPADSGMVLADFPLSETADPRWMSIFAALVAQSAANAWTVTGESIRLRSASSPEALRADIAVLRRVVARANADYNGSGEDEPLTALRQVIDDEFDGR